MNQLDGKVAVVTGAAQGIGLGIARALLSAGAAVVLSDMNAAEGQRVTAELAASTEHVAFYHADVAEEAAVRNLIESAATHFGRLDIVVNNAGVVAVQSVEEASVADWDRVMAVNVRSIFLTTKYALPHLRRAGGGAILNVASVSSFFGQQHTPAYVASKGAALMLTKSLAVDYGPEHIRVNALCPGITDTPMLRYHARHADDPDAHLAQRLKRVPLGEMLYPDDMGRAAVFLCSADAAGITGASLVVDAGYSACLEFTPL